MTLPGGDAKNLSAFLRANRLTAVLGVGSELRGDDAAGILVARRLAKSPAARQVAGAGARAGGSPRLVALEGHTAPESLAGKIIKLRPSHLLIVDAAEIGRAPGEWAMLSGDELDATITTTHLIPLSVLARHIEDEAGCAVGFLGVQPADCGVAVGASKAVLAAVDDVVRNIVQALGKKRP